MMVEQPIVFPMGKQAENLVLVNDIAQRGAQMTASHDNEEFEQTRQVWKFPAGSVVILPDRAGGTLVTLGYAVEWKDPNVDPLAPPAPDAP
jgi:hypothetical protein